MIDQTWAHVADGSKAAVTASDRHFCYAPNSGHNPDIPERQLCAIMKRLMHRGNFRYYSINSSARASSVGGILRPSALAVLRLTTGGRP